MAGRLTGVNRAPGWLPYFSWELEPATIRTQVLGWAVLVAYQALHRSARVKAGEKALIIGASGGIGHEDQPLRSVGPANPDHHMAAGEVGRLIDLVDRLAATAGALFVWPFVFDATFTLIRRAIRRENVLHAHRSHLYQRLVLTGVPHAPVHRSRRPNRKGPGLSRTIRAGSCRSPRRCQ